MLIYPAIDLRGGACVRLAQGRFDAVTDYGDPFTQLRAFEVAGAEWVHIVDLDGAESGSAVQRELIGRLAVETRMRVQSGGGVRSFEDAQALLEAGVIRRPYDKVKILGSGELKKKLTIVANKASESAKAAIEKAGGSLTLQ